LGPQKGASPTDVELLERGLARLAVVAASAAVAYLFFARGLGFSPAAAAVATWLATASACAISRTW